MIDKRLWSGAIAAVTLIVAGAGALPDLLLRPASTGPTVIVPLGASKFEPITKPEQIATVGQSVSARPTDRGEIIAPPAWSTVEAAPEPVAAAPEALKLEPEVRATPDPAPSVAFPPVQTVGMAATSVPNVVPPASPRPTPANVPHAAADKPAQPERISQRPAKPRQNVRPAAYPIGEFLAFRR